MQVNNYDVIRIYIDQNPIATLGTIDSEDLPRGAAVYICADANRPIVYFITKQATAKYQNLRDHPQVSLTIVNPSENSTIQANGEASEVSDARTIDMVMDKITRAHDSAASWLPPIAKIRAGAYVIIKVEISQARLAHFKGMAIGDEHIFTNL